jgi:hypothetical protein
VKAVLKLYQSEKERYEDLLGAIKDPIEKLTPYARAVWIQDFPDEFGDPMIMGVLHETKCLANYIHRLQKRLYHIEQNFDLTIEVNGYTIADFPNLKVDQVALLYGVIPFPDRNKHELDTKILTHEEKDQLIMELSRRLSEAIEIDTSLVRRTKGHIQRILKSEQGSATKEIEEWRDILESYSNRRLSQFLISTSERANRLRQSNPIFAILNSDEKSRLLNGLGGNI